MSKRPELPPFYRHPQRPPEPHCDTHRAFEFDCLDCSDALEKQRAADSAGAVLK